MSRKMQSEKENMTLMQKRAVLVCILCVLAVLLTFGITTALLKKGGDAPAPSVSESAADPAPGEDLSSHYQIDNASAALLTETADAGADYLDDTLFLGDSNTVRLYNNGTSRCSSSAQRRASVRRRRSTRASLPLRKIRTATPSRRL